MVTPTWCNAAAALHFLELVHLGVPLLLWKASHHCGYNQVCKRCLTLWRQISSFSSLMIYWSELGPITLESIALLLWRKVKGLWWFLAADPHGALQLPALRLKIEGRANRCFWLGFYFVQNLLSVFFVPFTSIHFQLTLQLLLCPCCQTLPLLLPQENWSVFIFEALKYQYIHVVYFHSCGIHLFSSACG